MSGPPDFPRPTSQELLRARQSGVCPWCGAPVEGVESEFCPECGHHTRAALGPPDPGSRSRARLAAFMAFVLIVAVALIQQLGGSKLAPKSGPAAQGAVEPPTSQFELTGRLTIKIHAAFPSPDIAKSAMSNLDSQAKSPEDEVRAAIAAGEMEGPGAALSRLDVVEPKLAPESPLVGDVAALRKMYHGEPPEPEAIRGLKERHAYFGRLAAVYKAPKTDPERASITGGGHRIVWTMLFVGLAVVSAILAGLVLLIIGVVQASSWKLRPAFVPPAPGGSAAIEVVAVFVLGFLILKGVGALADQYMSARGALWLTLLGQWALLAVVLWPRFIGAPRGRGMTLLGWHKGRGVVTEIGCGVLGYLACLPLLIGGAIVSLVLMLLHAAIKAALGGTPPPAPENPVLDIAAGKAGPVVVVIICLLATLWAPIVEETVFRGGLYRQLRSRWHWLAAAGVTALAFGVLHAYPVLMMGPVIALGFGFAMLREWRGSLIASMTAHCIHNAMVLGVILMIVRLVSG